MASNIAYDPISADEQVPMVPDSSSRPGREVRLLGGVLVPGKRSAAGNRRRMTPIAVVIVVLLVIWPTLHSIIAPLYSETCTSGANNSPVRRGQAVETDPQRFLKSGSIQDELVQLAAVNSSYNQEGPSLEREDCTLEGRSRMTLLSALVLVLILKISTVRNLGDLIGSTDAAKRDGLGGVFFRLVGLWNFWGPVCILAATIIHFQGSFTGSLFEIVQNVTSGSYYIVEHPANLTDSNLVSDCAEFDDFADVRHFSRIALGAGAVLTFTVGSFFFGLGELFKIDMTQGFFLEKHVNFEFVEYFHSAWRSDKLLDGYDNMISSFHDMQKKHGADIAAIGKSLENLENGALEALAGPAKRFEELGKERLVGQCRYMLEPLFLEKAGLHWNDALVVLKKVSIAGLVEKGPHAWFEETWEHSIPVLKSLTLQNMHKLSQVQEWLVMHGVGWDEMWPIFDEYLDLDALKAALVEPEVFLKNLMNIGPVALKCAVGALRKIGSVNDLITKYGVNWEDAIRVFQKFSFEDLQAWVAKIANDPSVAEDLLKFIGKAGGPICIMWELAQLRPKMGKSLQEEGVTWDDAVHLLENSNSVEDLHQATKNPDALKKRFGVSWEIAKSRKCIEPDLKERGLRWPVFRETLESSANSEDVEEATTNPKRFLDNLDEWKKRKQEEAERKQSDEANAAVNNIEQLKVIWPALCQCAATSLWLGTTYVDTHPCVSFHGGSSIFGFLALHSGLPYVYLLMYTDYVMIAGVVLFLGFEVLAMRHKWKIMEKKGPIAIAGVMGVYLAALAHLSISKGGKGMSGILKSAASGAAENLKSAPLGTVMSVGYVTEAGCRVTASKISAPSKEEQSTYKEHRNKLIEEKTKELAEVAPPELKEKVKGIAERLEETRKEVMERKEKDEEEERQRREEALRRFQEEQEAAAAALKAAEAEAERKRRAEEEERKRLEEVEKEEARRKAEEEAARMKAEREAQLRLEELLKQGKDIDLNLPFKQNFSKIEQPELWKEELDRLANAVKELGNLQQGLGQSGPALVIMISVTAIGKSDVKGMDGLMERRAETIKRELYNRGIRDEDLVIGMPRFEDPPPRVVIRAVKPDEVEKLKESRRGQEKQEAEEAGQSKSKSERSKKPKK